MLARLALRTDFTRGLPIKSGIAPIGWLLPKPYTSDRIVHTNGLFVKLFFFNSVEQHPFPCLAGSRRTPGMEHRPKKALATCVKGPAAQ
jgi:hypothetical protein